MQETSKEGFLLKWTEKIGMSCKRAVIILNLKTYLKKWKM